MTIRAIPILLGLMFDPPPDLLTPRNAFSVKSITAIGDLTILKATVHFHHG